MKIFSRQLLALILSSFSVTLYADDVPQGDMYIPGYTPPSLQQTKTTDQNYSFVDYDYQSVVNYSRQAAQFGLRGAVDLHNEPMNDQVDLAMGFMQGYPYLATGAMGEGDWQPASNVYKPGAVHIQQDPVYRSDGFNCQTFVQWVMAVLYTSSVNMDQFDKVISNIAYGAAEGSPGTNKPIHYYNRNNFPDADFNPINENNGYLTDITSSSPNAKAVSATITRQNWFNFQIKNTTPNVRVLNGSNGPSMVNRFSQVYANLNYRNFDQQNISTSYFPKNFIALLQSDGSYQLNPDFVNELKTRKNSLPAVMEIVRDPTQWMIGGQPIRNVIGSDLTISHMGILFNKTFRQGEFIYMKTTCQMDSNKQKTCAVAPVYCQKDTCDEIMLQHVTDAYPNNYLFYRRTDGTYGCDANPINPEPHAMSTCNRVMRIPLLDYLTDYQYGHYWYMDNPSIVGVHLESLAQN